MLTKLSTFSGTDNSEPVRLFRQGSSITKLAGDYVPEVQDWLGSYTSDAENIAVLVSAMGSSEYWGQNKNGDRFYWPALSHECSSTCRHGVDSFTGRVIPAYGYQTFVRDALPFVHHRNKDPTRAFGKVAVSCLNRKMKRVELVVLINRADALAYGAEFVLDRLDKGEFPDVSMGCRVPYDICTICGHKSRTPKDYCEHVAGLGLNTILPDGRKVGVINPYPRFFDISFVFVGACRVGKTMAKFASGLRLPDSVQNAINIYSPDPAGSMSKVAAEMKTKTFTIEGSSDLVDQVEKVLAAAQELGRVGSTRTVKVGIDGDGGEILKIEGARKVDPVHFYALSDKDEFYASQVRFEKEKKASRKSIEKVLESYRKKNLENAKEPISIKKQFIVEGKPATVERVEKLLTLCSDFSDLGVSRDFQFDFDGDGPDRFKLLNKRQLIDRSATRKKDAIPAIDDNDGVYLEDFHFKSAAAKTDDRDTVKKKFEVEGNRHAVERVEKLLSAAAYLGNIGSFREINFPIDGDGIERLKVYGVRSLDTNHLYDLIQNSGHFAASSLRFKGQEKTDDPWAHIKEAEVIDVDEEAKKLMPGPASDQSGEDLKQVAKKDPKSVNSTMVQDAVEEALGANTPAGRFGLSAEQAKVANLQRPPYREEYPYAGTRKWRGLTIHVENPAGTWRSGKGWATKMQYDYGEVEDSLGADGDPVDVYLGPVEAAPNVYVVHQNHVMGPNKGEYDEDKCMLGFRSSDEAKKAYLAHYDRPDFFRSITEIPFDTFKKMIMKGDGEKIAGNFELEELFLGAKTACRRERSWSSGGDTKTRVGSGWTKEASRKSASEKKADIDKLIEPDGVVGLVTRVLHLSEPRLPNNLIDSMASCGAEGFSKALATPAAMGIVLDPSEFQRFMLTCCGTPDLARDFDSKGIVFGPCGQTEEECKDWGVLDPSKDIDTDLIEKILPFLEQRSYLRPVLARRILSLSITPAAPRQKEEIMENSPLRTKLASSYNWYRKQMGKLASYGSNTAMDRSAHFKAAVHGVVDEGIFFNKKATDLASVGTSAAAVPLVLMLSSAARRDVESGEDVGVIRSLLASHPYLSALGGTALARAIMEDSLINRAVRDLAGAAVRQ